MATPSSPLPLSAWLVAFRATYQHPDNFGICLNINALGTVTSQQTASRGMSGAIPILIAEEL